MKIKTHILATVLFLGALIPVYAGPFKLTTEELDAKIVSAQTRFEALQAKPTRGIPSAVLKEARGIVIMRKLKAGLGFGAEAGGGVALVKTADGRWSPPAFVGAADASWGFQIGAQDEDVIIVLMTEGALQMLREGKKGSIAVESQAAIGPVDSSINLDTKKLAPILIYKDAAGGFVGLTLKAGGIVGSKRKNQTYYGMSLQSILFSGQAPTSATSQELIKSIEKSTAG